MRSSAIPSLAVAAVALLFWLAPSRAVAQTAGSSAAAPSSAPGAAPAAPALDSTRVRLARELLGLMRAGPAMLQGLELGLASQKATNSNLPEAFWTELAARAKRDLPKFVESVVPIYANRFTTQELEQLIAFYRSPTGRRLAEEGPAISVEMMRAGQRWGVELGAETAKDLAARGLMFP